MDTTKITTTQLRQINRSKVYEYIYEKRAVSKQEVVHALQMSLPTVTQNLNDLEAAGLIERTGFLASTGGRKPQMFSCCADARIALGLELRNDLFRIAAIDLYGAMFKEETHPMEFQNTPEYLQTVSCSVDAFAASLGYPDDSILGIGIAASGLVSEDGQYLTYSKLLGCSEVRLNDLARHLNYPAMLIHDAMAAAFAELWFRSDISDAVYLSLNRNLGGAVILNGTIYQGTSLISGTFEHMCLVPHGRSCYCGKKGCVEAYCSANSLMERANGIAGLPRTAEKDALALFFEKFRSHDPDFVAIWRDYLSDLSLAISNIRHVLDSDFIISGLLHTYLQEEDYEELTRLVAQRCVFPARPLRILPGKCPKQAAAIGAALHYIREFLQTI